MEEELDLANEVRTIETFRGNGSQTGQLVVPEVHAQLSSSRIIVMEYLEGVSVTRVREPDERKRIARVLRCSIGTVMSRLHYARKYLKQAMYVHAVV